MEAYAEIAAQPESTLRELLEHESPQVRLHAAWATGMRKGQASLGDIASRVGREPSAGVRQHLMIMLAGGGERPVMATFAALDPDALVRATACQCLARLVGLSDLPFYDVLLERAAHEPKEDVRCAASPKSCPRRSGSSSLRCAGRRKAPCAGEDGAGRKRQANQAHISARPQSVHEQ